MQGGVNPAHAGSTTPTCHILAVIFPRLIVVAAARQNGQGHNWLFPAATADCGIPSSSLHGATWLNGLPTHWLGSSALADNEAWSSIAPCSE